MPLSSSKFSRLEADIRRWLGQVSLSIFLFGVIFSLAACGSSSSSAGEQNGDSTSSEIPELTDDIIRERINGGYVDKIPEENGPGKPISWRFYDEEPKQISVVEKQVDGPHATVVLDIKTQSGPRAREPRALAGQIRTSWELRTGWVLRKWEIVRAENISMTYKSLPKPPAQNSNIPEAPSR